jgi:hypothetical protein
LQFSLQAACSETSGYTLIVTTLTLHQQVKQLMSFMSSDTRSPSFSQYWGLPETAKQFENQLKT